MRVTTCRECGGDVHRSLGGYYCEDCRLTWPALSTPDLLGGSA